MKKLNLIWMLNKMAVVLVLLAAVTSSALAVELKSPDGKVVVNFDLKDVRAAKGCPVYNVSFQGRAVLADSRLGLELRGSALNSDFKIAGQKTSASDTSWKPLLGERALIRDQYNQLVVELQETRPPQRKLQLTFRAYNEGVAFCYTLPAQAGLADFVITRETTQFAFTGDHTAWAVYAAQGNYNPDDPRRQPRNNGKPDALSLTRALRRQQARIEDCFTSFAVEVEGIPEMQLEFELAASGKLESVRIMPAVLAKTPLGRCKSRRSS